jgi:hypothetical protein
VNTLFQRITLSCEAMESDTRLATRSTPVHRQPCQRAILALASTVALLMASTVSANPPRSPDEEERQQLERVEIVGQALFGPPMLGDGSLWLIVIPPRPISNPGQLVDIALLPRAFNGSVQDARCSAEPDVRNSTGTQAQIDRNIVADRMYEAYAARFQTTLAIGTRFPVIYGNGSSEIWQVTRALPGPSLDVGPLQGATNGPNGPNNLTPAGTQPPTDCS